MCARACAQWCSIICRMATWGGAAVSRLPNEDTKSGVQKYWRLAKGARRLGQLQVAWCGFIGVRALELYVGKTPLGPTGNYVSLLAAILSIASAVLSRAMSR